MVQIIKIAHNEILRWVQKENLLTMQSEVSVEDILRADVYRLLAVLLRSAPDEENLAMLSTMRGDKTVLGQAVASLAMLAQKTTPSEIDIEYHALFIGTDAGELDPYGSAYIQGPEHEKEHEKALDQLRTDMSRVGIGMRGDVEEPEDHIAALCEMMAGMILGDFVQPVSLEEQKDFFSTHIKGWAKDFFTDLQRARYSVFYTGVGAIGSAFMDIEASAFEML